MNKPTSKQPSKPTTEQAYLAKLNAELVTAKFLVGFKSLV